MPTVKNASPTSTLHGRQVRNLLILRRFQGCLLAGAIGDAMGKPVETLSRERIRQHYRHVEGFLPHKTRKATTPPGSWSDDTYMMMLTAKSILARRGIDIEALTSTYIDALSYDFGIAGTTRRALEIRATGREPTEILRGNRRSGAGAAVRIAPVALFEYSDLGTLQEKVEAVSRITHSDHDAVSGAVAVAFTIAWAVRGELDPKLLLTKLKALMQERKSNLVYTLGLVAKGLSSNVDTIDGIKEIGADGATMRLIPSALFAFLKSPDDLEQTILAAVNAGGDTDTRAAIAGYISGAYNGIGRIPPRWKNRLQDNSIILDYAQMIFNLRG